MSNKVTPSLMRERLAELDPYMDRLESDGKEWGIRFPDSPVLLSNLISLAAMVGQRPVEFEMDGNVHELFYSFADRPVANEILNCIKDFRIELSGLHLKMSIEAGAVDGGREGQSVEKLKIHDVTDVLDVQLSGKAASMFVLTMLSGMHPSVNFSVNHLDQRVIVARTNHMLTIHSSPASAPLEPIEHEILELEALYNKEKVNFRQAVDAIDEGSNTGKDLKDILENIQRLTDKLHEAHNRKANA